MDKEGHSVHITDLHKAIGLSSNLEVEDETGEAWSCEADEAWNVVGGGGRAVKKVRVQVGL